MKVALFTDTYDEINGVSNTFHRLIEYAKRKNKKIEIFTFGEKDSIERINKDIKIHRYKIRIPIKIYSDLSVDLNVLNSKLINYFKKNKFELIHTATPGNMGINALYVAKRFKIPLIGSYHTELPRYVKVRVDKIVKKIKWPDKKAAKNLESMIWEFLKIYYKDCKVILAPSEDTKKVLEKKFNKKIKIFSRGIDCEEFNPKKKNKYFKKWYEIKDVAVLYVGRVSIEKNLDALEKCFRDIKNANLVVVGDGPYRKEMENKLKNAEFLGFQGGERLRMIYASCDFFVFPSKTDTFGNVVLEAMASSLPVVVSNVGGPKELVKNGESGFICKNLEEFKNKIHLLIKDKKLREKIGKNARKEALKRSWDNVFGKLFRDYNELV